MFSLRPIQKSKSLRHYALQVTCTLLCSSAVLAANVGLSQEISTHLQPVDATSVLPEGEIFSCPFEALKAAYVNVLNDKSLLNINAVEAEVLTLCTERQGVLVDILKNEQRLQDLLLNLEPSQNKDIAPPETLPAAAQVQPMQLDEPATDSITPITETTPASAPSAIDQMLNGANEMVAQIIMPDINACADLMYMGFSEGIRGKTAYVVIEDSPNEMISVRVNDKLACGATIEAIEANALSLKNAAQQKIINRSDNQAEDTNAAIFMWHEGEEIKSIENNDVNSESGDNNTNQGLDLNRASQLLRSIKGSR